MKINKKPILTDSYVNKCVCGKNVVLKRCIWLDEAEDVLNAFSETALRLGKPTLNPAHKMREFWFNSCPCGRLFYSKDK